MSGFSLYKFQANGLKECSEELRVVDSVIGVAPTGAGKCILICAAASEYLNKNPNKKVIIFVHKMELLQNVREDLLNLFNIMSQKIDAKTNYIDNSASVFVSMVETFDRRSDADAFLDKFKSVGLFMVDECHLGNFNKVIIHFLHCKRFGVTATPIASNKKFPLNKVWNSCKILATTEELLELNQLEPSQGIVPCDAYAPDNINRDEFKKKSDGEFDEKFAGKKLSSSPNIKNTFDNYIKLAYGKKTIIFNSDIEHSLKVYEVFKEAGFSVRQLDSDKKSQYSSDEYRRDTFKWFKETPGAILCNVGIATIGVNEKSIECIILNMLTSSLSKLIQMIGRGARAYIWPDGRIKDGYLCIDMCGNFNALKINPNKNVDWIDKFNNPNIPKGDGISPVKICPECRAMNSATARVCAAKAYIPLLDLDVECGYVFPVEDKIADIVPRELVRLFQDSINVKTSIEVFKDTNEWRGFYNIIKGVALLAKKEFPSELEVEHLEFLFETVHNKTTEWFKLSCKRKYRDFKHDIKLKLITAMSEVGIQLDIDMVNSLTKKQDSVGSTIYDPK